MYAVLRLFTSLACFLPTPSCYILGISLHLYPRSCIKLLGILTLPVLASLAFSTWDQKAIVVSFLHTPISSLILPRLSTNLGSVPAACLVILLLSRPVLLLNISFPDSSSRLMLKLSCAAPLPLCSQLCFPYQHLPS